MKFNGILHNRWINILFGSEFKRTEEEHDVILQLSDIHDAGSSLKTRNDCVRWAVKLLDAASSLARLREEASMPEMTHRIRREFVVARRVMVWAAEKNIGRVYASDAASLWPDLAEYIRKHTEIGIAGDDALPGAIMKFESLNDGPGAGCESADGKPE